MNFKNKNLVTLKNKILESLTFMGIIAFILVSVINFINKRPSISILSPLGASLFVAISYLLLIKKKHVNIIRNILIIFLLLYYPYSWFTTPGSYSAMLFYSVLIFFIVSILVQEYWEFAYSLIFIAETVFLLNYEHVARPESLLYSTYEKRPVELSCHFLIVAVVLLVVVLVSDNYFGREHRQILFSSITDPLTGLYNRRYFNEILKEFDTKTKESDFKYSIIMMDLNFFKKVNDLYGHLEGDKVLKKFAEVLIKTSRKTDIAVRYGGDEFALILYNIGIEESKSVEKRIAELFQKTCDLYSNVKLGVSFGAAECNEKGFENLLKTADDLLYKDKSKQKRKQ